MALWELLRALRRHPVVVAVGLLATLVALLGVRGHQGVYETRMGMVLAPVGTGLKSNPYYGRDYSLIASAGVLANVVNQSLGRARTSTTVSLSGKGVKDGYAVDLPNKGGQFVFDFDRPILDIQAVGPTPERVQQNLDEAVRVIESALARLQDEAAVPTDIRIVLHPEPAQPVVFYGRGQPARSLLATLVLGLALTLSAVLVIDDRRSRGTPAAADQLLAVPT